MQLTETRRKILWKFNGSRFVENRKTLKISHAFILCVFWCCDSCLLALWTLMYPKTIEIPQRTFILKTNYCLNVHTCTVQKNFRRFLDKVCFVALHVTLLDLKLVLYLKSISHWVEANAKPVFLHSSKGEWEISLISWSYLRWFFCRICYQYRFHVRASQRLLFL